MGTYYRLFIFSQILLFAHGANILAIFHLPGKSHYNMFEAVLKGLAAKGHNVDVASFFPQKEPIPRFNDLSLLGSIPILTNNMSMDFFKELDTNYKLLKSLIEFFGEEMCEKAFKSKTLKDLKNTTKKYDLLITEMFTTDCMLGFAHIFNVPYVTLTSSVDLPWGGVRIGNPDNPSYITNYFLHYGPQMTLWERLVNTRYVLEAKFYYNFLFKHDKSYREFFGPEAPPLDDLVKNVSLIIVNSHYSTHQSRPTVPNFIEVGGLHIKPPKPLNETFQKLLKFDEKTQKGVIYMTMGSLVLLETFDPVKLQMMFDAFAELPYKILCKATREKLPSGLKIPNNIHFLSWMPQLEILCHPNVKVFISHGGLMGSQEAIYCGVPRLGIPLFADQENNIKIGVSKGVVVRLAYEDITKDSMLNALKKLTEDPMYYQNAQKLSEIFKDRPMSPLDTAIYWIEHVIRHKGAPHLRSHGADLPWYQYYLVDVALIYLLGISFVLYAMFYCIDTIFYYAAILLKRTKYKKH